jgi:hypothetical protein
VRALPAVVASRNDEPTRLTGKMPSAAIKAASVAHKPAVPVGRAVGLEPILSSSDVVRYLYQPGELEGGQRRPTDTLRNVVRQSDQPALYYLNNGSANALSAFRHQGATPAPTRGFVREELLIILLEPELPPSHSVGGVTHKSR